MKTCLRSWPNPFSRILLGGWLLAAPLALPAQTAPLQSPAAIGYPGVYQSFEKMLEFDEVRYAEKAKQLQGATRSLAELADVEKVDIDPDFMNSLILNSSPGYLRLAGQNRCAFYDVLLADLLRTKDGKVREVWVQYRDKQGTNVSAVATKQDFLDKVVFKACPRTQEAVRMFQVRSLDATIKATNFSTPMGRQQCEAVFAAWSADSKTPYWCQVHEVMKEGERLATAGAPAGSDPRAAQAAQQAVAMARILRGKLSDSQEDFLERFCENADNAKPFCDGLLTTSFFSKVAEGLQPDIHVRQLCREVMGTENWTPAVRSECIRRLRADPAACAWTARGFAGLSPRPRCDQLSTALNASNLWTLYEDCPRHSDQQAVTNMARVLLHTEQPPVVALEGGLCSALSATTFMEFNRRYDNENAWAAGVCYLDRVEEKERCLPAFFGDHPTSPAAITRVVGEVLTRTKGAAPGTKCTLVRQDDWSPVALQYKYGCFIVVDMENCGLAQCGHKVVFNEREIKDLKLKTQLAFDYFPTSLTTEKYSQTYVLQREGGRRTRALQTLPAVGEFFRGQPKGIAHGVACAEDLLPGFFRKRSFNQCTPLPFIVDGLVQEGDKASLVTRSAADDVHAPRLVPWARLFAAVKAYQALHPLRQWSFHAVY